MWVCSALTYPACDVTIHRQHCIINIPLGTDHTSSSSSSSLSIWVCSRSLVALATAVRHHHHPPRCRGAALCRSIIVVNVGDNDSRYGSVVCDVVFCLLLATYCGWLLSDAFFSVPSSTPYACTPSSSNVQQCTIVWSLTTNAGSDNSDQRTQMKLEWAGTHGTRCYGFDMMYQYRAFDNDYNVGENIACCPRVSLNECTHSEPVPELYGDAVYVTQHTFI